MPRIARVVGIGLPHHVTQRGNYRQQIFEGPLDYQKYLSFLENERLRYGIDILAYCLMPNHVHFIAIPRNYDSLGKFFKYVNMKYAQYFNKKKGQRGHLFQGRFFSSIMDEPYTIACARYIERNPVRAKMAKNAWGWKWSSSQAHCGVDKRDGLEVKKIFSFIDIPQCQWEGFIDEEDKAEEVALIRKQTLRGRPIAGHNFIEHLEKQLNRILIVKTKGRPKKIDKK